MILRVAAGETDAPASRAMVCFAASPPMLTTALIAVSRNSAAAFSSSAMAVKTPIASGSRCTPSASMSWRRTVASVSVERRARSAAPAGLPASSRVKPVNACAAARRTPGSASASAAVSAASAGGVPAHATLCGGGGFFTGCVPHHLPS